VITRKGRVVTEKRKRRIPLFYIKFGERREKRTILNLSLKKADGVEGEGTAGDGTGVHFFYSKRRTSR